MENKILGLHHITAIAGDAKRNFNFYSNILGLRFIKKTVNFDDPGTYHFYFGDEVGSAGTILTFSLGEKESNKDEKVLEWQLKLDILFQKEAWISGKNVLKNIT
ncbi:VOC family protein [Flavobacterium sp. P21]|uniref:VOC family protein n=1 Tax=Flavobacterium sp. P21 TaxID=3423948 RepID=UPI003D66DBB8